MAEQILPAEPINESYDVFLCTRDLPDALTAETAALRQLCSALVGEGYRVFFPSAIPVDLRPEDREQRIDSALKSARVMVAAAVGDEGLQDEKSRKLWRRFLDLSREDPGRAFLPCLRDAEARPEEWAGQEILDMSDLRFLVSLKEKITAALAPARSDDGEPAPAPEEALPAEPEDVPAAESAPTEPEFPPEEPAAPSRRRWPWLALAAAGVVILVLIVLLCLR